MADEMEFVDGLVVKPPHERAPDFVKAAISIKVEALSEWLKHKAGEEWVNIDVKVARSGKWYAAVSKYKKEEKATVTRKPVENKTGNPVSDMDDDIPF